MSRPELATCLEVGPRVTFSVSPCASPLAELNPAARHLVAALARGEGLDSALEDYLRREPRLRARFDLGLEQARSTHFLERPLLYPEPALLDFVAAAASADAETEQLGVQLSDAETAASVGDVLRLVAAGRHAEGEVRELLDALGLELLDELLRADLVVRAPPRARRDFSRPGLYRLQHASLLFRTSSTGVLVDPQLHGSLASLPGDYSRAELDGQVDAIVISHSHGDHFNLATLLQFRRDIPLIVPAVPRTTLICTAMGDQLRQLGFTDVREPAWFAPPVQIGDIEIQVLPFYGEQPLVTEHLADPSMRNWGNTYLVRTPELSAWILIDSGQDAMGDMGELATHVHDRHGPVDLVLSNLRTFPVTPFQISGLGEYWWALTREQMASYERHRGASITLAPAGVARVCQNVRARSFLPYAHWWATPGAPVGQEGSEGGEGETGCEEVTMVAELRAELTRLRATTIIEDWRVGSRANRTSLGLVFEHLRG